MTTPTVTPRQPLDWVGDPAVLVFAVRYALTTRASHAPELMRQTLAANRGQIPATALTQITKDIRAWLAGDGHDRTPAERTPWEQALIALTDRARPHSTSTGARR